MTAPEKPRSIAVIHTSDLAVRDNDPHWTEIHRVLDWKREAGGIKCHLACGGDVISPEVPVSLSSGEINGCLCRFCFGHLVRGAA